MPFEFTVDLSALFSRALTVVAILAITLVALFAVRRGVSRVITARIPRIREESPDSAA